MTNVDRTGILLTDEQRKSAITSIVDFYGTERDEEIGPQIYNKAIQESKDFVKTRLEELELDMEVLKKG